MVVHAAAAGRSAHVDCAVYATVAVDAGCSSVSHRLESFSQSYYGFSAETLRLVQAVTVGAPERCASFLGDYVAAGADHLVLRVGDLDGSSQLDALAHVRDLVRSRFPTVKETA